MQYRSPPRLSLRELLTIPIFAAAAMACVASAVRSGAIRQYGLVQVVLIEAIVIPIAMAVVAQVLLTRGPRRERVVAIGLWLSAMAGIVAALALGAVTVWDVGASLARGRGLPVDLLAFLLVLAGGLVALGEAAQVLRARIGADRCPICGLMPSRADRGTDAGRRRESGAGWLRCERCGRMLHRGPDGRLRDADDDRGAGAPPRRSMKLSAGGDRARSAPVPRPIRGA